MERAPTLNVRPLAIADLKPHPRNYQRHPEAQRDELVKSIRRHGAYKNAVVSADGYILAGHGILAAARADGWKEWPCEVRPYNHDHPDALNLIVTDNEVGNPANELGPDPDRELLAALLKDVEASTGLAGTGYDEKALAALLSETSGNGQEPLEDPGPQEPPKEPVTRPGDLWLVGPHRIMCCDCRDESALAKLFGEERARMVWTDPPYGISMAPVSHGRKMAALENDDLDGDGLREFLVNGLSLAKTHVDGDAFVCCDWRNFHVFREAMCLVGWPVKCVIVWNKETRAQNLNRFAFVHEFICYSGPMGPPTADTNVWTVGREYSDDHLTPKPPELIRRSLRPCSAPGEIVFDPFVGSGSTAIAAAQEGRVCFCCDVEARYVDVTVQRLSAATSQRAILESTGQPFPLFEEATDRA